MAVGQPLRRIIAFQVPDFVWVIAGEISPKVFQVYGICTVWMIFRIYGKML